MFIFKLASFCPAFLPPPSWGLAIITLVRKGSLSPVPDWLVQSSVNMDTGVEELPLTLTVN